jgi:beta-glucosidase/6-phospho-beta-glucosidase/beta-galactosidase
MFKSFFLAGFEGSTGYNLHHQWIDQVRATQHDLFADEDYARLNELGIRAAREVVRWPLVDQNGRYDFSSLAPFLNAAQRNDVEIIFDLFHFGFPDHIDICSDDFPARFADYCHAVAAYLSENTRGDCFFTPINEPSFFSWAAGEAGLFAPHLTCRGWELKKNLVRAAIEGINAIWAASPAARIINVDPICRVAVPFDRPDLEDEAEAFNRNAVFQSWDMLCGRLMPELGGSTDHLGVIGINYYWTNQWEWGSPGIHLSDDDPRRWPLSRLIRSVWERYGADMLITETAHVGEMRPVWMRELAREAMSALNEGLPLKGVCLYPALEMPEWHKPSEWTRMGLWDLKPCGGKLERVPYEPMIEALREAQNIEQFRPFNATQPTSCLSSIASPPR